MTKSELKLMLSDKFNSKRQKWFKIKKTEKNVERVKNILLNTLKENKQERQEILRLFSFFKSSDFIWAKYKSIAGRKSILCNCSFNSPGNVEVKFKVTPDFVFSCEVLEGSPKSLGLFNSKHLLVNPKDKFKDHITTIEAWEEFTKEGYLEYVFEVENKLIYTSKKRCWRS